jgi:hypothetical protein
MTNERLTILARSARVCALLCAFVLPGAVHAHGGVSIEDDKCILRLGPYVMHFTGYQPEQSGAQEFCEDIPVTGLAVIVLDAVDDALRDMPIEVRILHDTQGIGNTARVQDLGGAEAITQATLAKLPATTHSTGSLTLKYPFAEPGRYIGYVRAEPRVGGPIEAVFPFSVGRSSKQWRIYVAIIVGTVLLAGGLFALATRFRHAQA